MVEHRSSAPEVTPFVGVWIETSGAYKKITICLVTPFVGVWIETVDADIQSIERNVTPFVGVWIETRSRVLSLLLTTSHTLRGCVD